MQKDDYSNYLLKRSLTGLFYRYFFIYPFFLRFLGNNNLDYGCGIGDFLKFCSLFNKKICGLDINRNNISICLKKGCDAKFIDSFQNYESYESSYDAIVLDNVLEHILDPHDTLIFINKILKKNGSVIIGIPVGKAGFNSDKDHKTYYDELSLDKLLNLYGFKKKYFFYRPINFKFLRDNLKQFCFFGIYEKVNK